MPKLKPEDLAKIAAKVKRTMILREGTGRAKIMVHMGTCGIAAGARGIMNTLMNHIILIMLSFLEIHYSRV